MAENKTYSSIEDYLKKLTDTYAPFQKLPAKARFFRSMKEFAENSGKVKDTCFVIQGITGRNVNNHENIVAAWQVIFTVYKRLSVNDFDKRSLFFDSAFADGNEYVSRFKKDRKNIALLYYFNAAEVSWRPATEALDNFVGADFTCTLYQPNNLKYNADKWL